MATLDKSGCFSEKKCFVNLTVTGMTLIEVNNGRRACAVGSKAKDGTKHVFMAYGMLANCVWKNLKVGHSISCIARPTENRWMDLRHIRFMGFIH